MTTPKWLDGYSGQSTAELLTLAPVWRTDSIVLAFEQALQARADRDGLASLTEAEVTVLAIEAYEREVNNGGHHQFFFNTPEYAPMIATALERIGCPAFAAIARDAVRLLDAPPDATPNEIQILLVERHHLPGLLGTRCDAPFFGTAEPIADRLLAFIGRHRMEVTVD